MNRELEALRDRVRNLNILYGAAIRGGFHDTADRIWVELVEEQQRLQKMVANEFLQEPGDEHKPDFTD